VETIRFLLFQNSDFIFFNTTTAQTTLAVEAPPESILTMNFLAPEYTG
jgi:hypothetical protein